MVVAQWMKLVPCAPVEVNTIGTVYGPGGGDNWTQLATLPAVQMPSGSRPYVFMVHGKIGRVQCTSSPLGLRGMVQLCLGTTAGLKHPEFRVSHQIAWPTRDTSGIAFQFLVFVNATFADSLLGSAFNPAGSELCLYARTFRNGDAPTYAVSFRVVDVNWLWFDLSAIPSGRTSMDQVTTSTTLGAGTPVAFERVGSSFGADSQPWLSFANVWCQSNTYNQPAPQFQFGVTPDGTFGSFVRKIGNSLRWGMQRKGSVPGVHAEENQWQMGGFWVHEGTQQAAYAAHEVSSVTVRTDVRRYRHFAVRLDELLDVHYRQEVGPHPMGRPITDPSWVDFNLVKERPVPSPLILHPTEPIVMMHGVLRWPIATATLASYGARILEDTGSVQLGEASCFTQANNSLNEAIGSMGFGKRTFQTTSPAMQWKCAAVGDDTYAPPQTVLVWDFCFVAFHPITGQTGTTGPGAIPSPVLLVPSKQSVAVGDLDVPPFPPGGDPIERGRLEPNEIRGVTGYFRGWPIERATRVFTVKWGPLDEDDAQQVFEFLRDNPAWRYVPPRGAALPVLGLTRATLEPWGHRTFSITQDVAVLVWTGS